MLVFEMVFIDCCNITNEVYRGWVGGRGVGWALGVGGKPKAGNTIHSEPNSSIVSSVEHRNSHSRPGRCRRSLAADTACSFISAPQWLHRPCSGLSWFYRVGKRPPVKADLATHSPVSGVSVWC